MRARVCRASCDSNADSERQHQVTPGRVLQSSSYSQTESSWRILSLLELHLSSVQSPVRPVRPEENILRIVRSASPN